MLVVEETPLWMLFAVLPINSAAFCRAAAKSFVCVSASDGCLGFFFASALRLTAFVVISGFFFGFCSLVTSNDSGCGLTNSLGGSGSRGFSGSGFGGGVASSGFAIGSTAGGGLAFGLPPPLKGWSIKFGGKNSRGGASYDLLFGDRKAG